MNNKEYIKHLEDSIRTMEEGIKAAKDTITDLKVRESKSSTRPTGVYKYPGASDLYIVAEISIGECAGNYTLVNLNTGVVGPIWEDPVGIIKDMILAANSIDDLKE